MPIVFGFQELLFYNFVTLFIYINSCATNMEWIYKWTPMQKFDLNKVPS